MKHVYLMNPFLWEGFKTLEFGNREIAWLLIVPISEQEKNYAIANGWEASIIFSHGFSLRSARKPS